MTEMKGNFIDKKILVTGGAGFIGSHIVDSLLSRGAKVVAYDNFDDYYSGKEKNVERNICNPNFKLIKADIFDLKTLMKTMSEVNMIFHLAAQPGVRFSVKNPLKTTRVNVIGTLKVLMAAAKNNVDKLIFASSSSVYGTSEHLPFDENQPTLPESIYGASKLAAEKYCEIFQRKIGLPVTILRYHTVYGPRQRPDMAILKFTDCLLQRKSPVVYGDGSQTRDFTFVSDIVNGTLLAAECETAEGEIFNIGSGTQVTITKVISILKKLTSAEDIDPEYVAGSAYETERTQANIKKALDFFGYQPRVRLEEGVKIFVKWFKSHRGI